MVKLNHHVIDVIGPLKNAKSSTAAGLLLDHATNLETCTYVPKWRSEKKDIAISLKLRQQDSSRTTSTICNKLDSMVTEGTFLQHIRRFSQQPSNQPYKSDTNSERQDEKVLEDLALSAAPLAKSVFSSPYQNGIADPRLAPRSGLSDLHMFLQEVGTDPKEARFWLNHFQSAVNPNRPFAIVQIEQEVIHNAKMLHSLCSCLSFLHRHQMQVIIIHGPETPISDGKKGYWEYRKELVNDSMTLVDALEYNDSIARPLMHGSSIFQVQDNGDPNFHQTNLTINANAVKWALRSGSVVILPSLGELSDGRLVPINCTSATSAIAKELKPLKVLIINDHGGLTNESGQVIANVNIPNDLNTIFQSSWCTSSLKNKITDVVSLLQCLPSRSSVVISSAVRLLAELFTHRGSGTFFKMSECVHRYKSMQDVDVNKLSQLIESGFGRSLSPHYIEKLHKNLNTIYIVDGYNAAAIITNEDGVNVPYLDKFVVCSSRTGESLGQMVWDEIREDFPQLFWRSRNKNIVNSWYFSQCDGCRKFDFWTVFWYGAMPESTANQLVEYAVSLPSSFTDTKNAKQLNRAKV